MTNEDIAYHFANWQRQKDLEENPKSSDSIPPDCVSNAKGEDRWHKVKDSLPDNTREVLCKDAIGNYFIGRYYSKGAWEISMYDDCDKSNEDNPPVVMWIDIPSEKQKEQKPAEWSEEDEKFFQLLHAGLYAMKGSIGGDEYNKAVNKLKSLHSHWKPTKEQMEALEEVIVLLRNLRRNTDDRKNLETLREQLGKL